MQSHDEFDRWEEKEELRDWGFGVSRVAVSE